MLLDIMSPALGAAGQHAFHQWWWIVLLVCVFVLVLPVAKAFAGRPRT